MYHLPAFPASVPDVHLHPGDIFCNQRPHIVTTILGSCVAVCLFDTRQGFGGMNHFILPQIVGDEPSSPRYGSVAIPMLVEGMLSLGSRRRDLEAKVFGGANVLPSIREEPTIGERNIGIALSELNRLNIPVVSRHLFGVRGVFIKQFTATGEVWLRHVQSRHGLARPGGPRSGRVDPRPAMMSPARDA